MNIDIQAAECLDLLHSTKVTQLERYLIKFPSTMKDAAARVSVYFEKLKSVASSRHEDFTEVTRLVRAVQDELAQHPELTCSVKQEKTLVSMSKTLLDQQLGDFLEELDMTEVAPTLVRHDLSNLNTLARAIVSPLMTDTLPPDVRSRLLAKLEVRGLILDILDIPKHASWFDRLCTEFPTLDSLQGQTWTQLQKLLAPTDDRERFPTASQTLAVQQVWSAGHELREKLLQYGLPPDFADILASQGCNTVREMCEQDLLCLQLGRNVEEKSNLRRLWRSESATGQTETKQLAQRRENLRDSTKRAVDLVETMRRNLKDKKTEDLASQTAELSEVLVALGVGDDQGLLAHTVSELTNYLDKLALILQNTARELDTHSREQYETDEQIVARMSAGQALCGVSLGMGANGLSQQPTRRLLRAPLYCPLLSPSESVKMSTVTFSNVSAADAFRSTVSSSGDTLTAALEASAWGLGSIKTSATRSKQITKAEAARQRRRTASAVALTYGLVPVKSLLCNSVSRF